MDSFGTVFLVIAVMVIIAASVGFWFLSRVAPKGVVLATGVALYVVGVFLTFDESRLMHGVAGLLKFTGFVGVVLGLVDLFRKRGYVQGNGQNMSALQKSLGVPTKSTKKMK